MNEDDPNDRRAGSRAANRVHGGVSLHIDRLVLEGVGLAAGGTGSLQSAVEGELARLITDGGLGPELIAGGAVPSLKTRGIQVARDANPSQLGLQIARSVYGGLRK